MQKLRIIGITHQNVKCLADLILAIIQCHSCFLTCKISQYTAYTAHVVHIPFSLTIEIRMENVAMTLGKNQ